METAEEKALRIVRLIGDRRREAVSNVNIHQDRVDNARTMMHRASARHELDHWTELRDIYTKLENDAKAILDS